MKYTPMHWTSKNTIKRNTFQKIQIFSIDPYEKQGLQDITLQRITNHIRDNKILASIYPSDNDDSILLQIYHCALLPSSTLRHHTNANLRQQRNTNTMAYKY